MWPDEGGHDGHRLWSKLACEGVSPRLVRLESKLREDRARASKQLAEAGNDPSETAQIAGRPD